MEELKYLLYYTIIVEDRYLFFVNGLKVTLLYFLIGAGVKLLLKQLAPRRRRQRPPVPTLI